MKHGNHPPQLVAMVYTGHDEGEGIGPGLSVVGLDRPVGSGKNGRDLLIVCRPRGELELPPRSEPDTHRELHRCRLFSCSECRPPKRGCCAP